MDKTNADSRGHVTDHMDVKPAVMVFMSYFSLCPFFPPPPRKLIFIVVFLCFVFQSDLAYELESRDQNLQDIINNYVEVESGLEVSQ